MGNDLVPVLDGRALDMLRVQLAPEATGAELEWFGHVAQHLGLDPFRGQLVLIGRWDKRVGRNVHRPQVTIDGRRALAVRTGELRGIDGPYWSGPRDEHGLLQWRELWDSDQHPYAARVFVYRHGWIKPANGTCKWSETAPTNAQGALTGLWPSMPAHMLGKAAEALALRRAFPEAVGGAVKLLAADVDDAEAEDVPPDAAPIVQALTEDAMTRSLSAPSTPDDYVFVVPTHEQYAELGRLWIELGMDGVGYRDMRLNVISEILGRDVTSTRLVGRDDAALLIEDLTDRLAR